MFFGAGEILKMKMKLVLELELDLELVQVMEMVLDETMRREVVDHTCKCSHKNYTHFIITLS